MMRTFSIFVLLVCAAGSAGAQKISTIAGSNWVFPATPLAAVQAPLGRLNAVAADSAGNYYISDGDNNLVLKVTASGTLTVAAGNGTAGISGDGGPATSAALSPGGIAVDHAGNLFIADTVHDRLRMVSPAAVITTVASGLYGPLDVAVDGAGNLFVTVSSGVVKVSPAGAISTVADGSAGLEFPWGIAVDSADNVFVADATTSVIVEISPAGTLTTIAGQNGPGGFSGDGGPASAASLHRPHGMFSIVRAICL
jgi:hypothetical protein